MLKMLVLLLLLAMLVSLFSGLYLLYRDGGVGERTVRALTWRIGLALALFAVLMMGFRFGFIPGYSQ